MSEHRIFTNGDKWAVQTKVGDEWLWECSVGGFGKPHPRKEGYRYGMSLRRATFESRAEAVKFIKTENGERAVIAPTPWRLA